MEVTSALLRAIALVSGSSIIVDSSKNPVRALALSQLPDVELFLVHLLRDSRAVAWSFAKTFKKDPRRGVQQDQLGVPPWLSALNWDFINLQSEWVRHHVPPAGSIRVRYEDLVRDPRTALQRIGALVGLDLSGVARAVSDDMPVGVGHLVAGNRLRMNHAVRLTSDESWRTLMPARDQTVAHALTLPLMQRYRYK